MPRPRKEQEDLNRVVTDGLLYAAVERFFGLVDEEPPPKPEDREAGKKSKKSPPKARRRRKDKKWNADDLVRWFRNQKISINREEIFLLIRRAIDQGFVKLCPPPAYHLQDQMKKTFPLMTRDVHVVEARPPMVGENLASEAADIILDLIKRIHAEKEAHPSRRTENPSRVHIGFGAGDTTKMVAQCLAKQMEMEASLPPLTFHAISSGFTINHPLSAPVAFFSYFTSLNHEIDYVGLFSQPMVKWQEYDKVKKLPVIKESFEEAEKIDLVVTSLAQADDEHGLLNMFLDLKGARFSGLKDAGQKGDILWQPYSATKPIAINTGIRAVTLFDLKDLVKRAATPGKHVVLVAGPCARCGKSKSDALLPLLTEPELLACNHLVTDVTTANEVLAAHQGR